MSAEIITLGCRLNAAESEAMRALTRGQDDLVIVNSCAVTREAVRQTRQAIRKAKRANPGARVMVTGCAAQIDPDAFAAMPEVARVIGNAEKTKPWAFARGAEDEARVRVSDIMEVRQTAPQLAAGFSERCRAFVEVQNGCDHRCTFCVIPYGRGNSRSVPAGIVVDTIGRLVDQGHQEIVLTGVDITSYGHDLPGRPSLGLLVERILSRLPGLRRLRLSSIDCIELDDRLFEIATGETRFMPHLHMSFQSGDDMILKRMKRRHSRVQAIETVVRLKEKRPEIAIGADLIAGFPTETEDMHRNSLALVAQCDIVMGHVFPFSPRAFTPASRMPQLDRAVVKARAAELRQACAARRGGWLQRLVGTRQSVLVERDDGNGHAESFAPVRVNMQQEGRVGRVLECRITGIQDDVLVGEAA